jgi:plastocyanin
VRATGPRSALVASLVLLCTVPQGAARGQGTAVVAGTVQVTGARTSANVVVSLEAPGLVPTPPTRPIEMDQKAMQFVPRVLPVVRGTTVRFLNNDREDHNVYSPEGGYNLGTWAPGLTRDHVFTTPGVYTQLCRVHPDMEAFVVVLETPYFAVTDAAGRYTIGGVPPGSYTLRTWGRRLRPGERPVTIEAGTTTTVDLVLTR